MRLERALAQLTPAEQAAVLREVQAEWESGSGRAARATHSRT
jgi:hypothetical protein